MVLKPNNAFVCSRAHAMGIRFSREVVDSLSLSADTETCTWRVNLWPLKLELLHSFTRVLSLKSWRKPNMLLHLPSYSGHV